MVVDVGQNRLNSAARFNQQHARLGHELMGNDAVVRKEEGLHHNAVDVANADGLIGHSRGVVLNKCLDHHDPGPCKTKQATIPCSSMKRKQRCPKGHASKCGIKGCHPCRVKFATRDDAFHKDFLKAEGIYEAEWHTWKKAKKDVLSRGDSFFKRLLKTLLGTWLGFSSLETQVFIIITSFLAMIGCLWNRAKPPKAAKAAEMQPLDWIVIVGQVAGIFTLCFMYGPPEEVAARVPWLRLMRLKAVISSTNTIVCSCFNGAKLWLFVYRKIDILIYESMNK